MAAPDLVDLRPMLLGEVKRPFSDPAYGYEIKYDGYRLLAECDGPKVRLQTRNGADATAWFPEITQGLAGLAGGRHVLDGEVCVLDDIGRSNFDRLHARAKRKRLVVPH